MATKSAKAAKTVLKIRQAKRCLQITHTKKKTGTKMLANTAKIFHLKPAKKMLEPSGKCLRKAKQGQMEAVNKAMSKKDNRKANKEKAIK